MGKQRVETYQQEEARNRVSFKPGTLPHDFVLSHVSNKSTLHVSDQIEI